MPPGTVADRVDLLRHGAAGADRQMGERPERGEAEPGRFVVMGRAGAAAGLPLVVAADHRRVGVRLVLALLVLDQPEAAGAGQADHRDRRVEEAREGPGRAGDRLGGAEQRVARDAAEAGRQRPARGRRERARHAARRAEADDPEQQPQLQPRQPVGAQEPHAPHRRRQREGQGPEAEELHAEIRHHRTAEAEEVAGRPRGGVVEARVVDRPGREGDREAGRPDEQGEAGDLRRPPRQERAERVEEAIVGRCRATKRTHADKNRVRGTGR